MKVHKQPSYTYAYNGLHSKILIATTCIRMQIKLPKGLPGAWTKHHYTII